MSLRDKSFERVLRERTREYDVRNGMRFWQKVGFYLQLGPDIPVWFLGTLLTLLLLCIIPYNRDCVREYPDFWMAGIGCWGWLLVLWRAEMTWNPKVNMQSGALWILPLSLSEAFKHFFNRFFLWATLVSAHFFIVYGVIATGTNAPMTPLCYAFVAATLQGIIAIALCLLLIASRLNPNLLIIIALSLSGFFAATLAFGTNPSLWLAQGLYIANPFGWASNLFLNGCVRRYEDAWWTLPLAFVLLSATPLLIRTLRRFYYAGVFRRDLRTPGAFQWRIPISEFPAQPAKESNPSISDFLQPRQWDKSGLVERWAARFLSARERNIFEMLLPPAPRLTRFFWGLVIYFGLYMVANLPIAAEPAGSFENVFITMFSSEDDHRLVLISLIACFVLSLMIIIKSFSVMFWQSSEKAVDQFVVGTSRAQYLFDPRLCPVNNWEQVKVHLKVSTFLALLLLPMVVMFTISPFYQLIPTYAHQALRFTPFKVLILCWCAVLCFSSFSLLLLNQQGLKIWLSFGKLLLMGGCLAGLAGSFVYCHVRWMQSASGIALVVASMIWLFYRGARYRAGRVI